MRTFFEGEVEPIYGEPTTKEVSEYVSLGIGLVEDWTGEVESLYYAKGRTFKASIGRAIVMLCPEGQIL